MYSNYIPQQRNNITWVQGIEGAKAFQLIPGSNIVLMDSENEGIFYIKTCDNVGMCNLRTFKFAEVQATPKADYITREEFYSALEGLKNEQPIQQLESAGATNSTEYATKSSNKGNYGFGKK